MNDETNTKPYEAPQVRSLGSLHELTQGGFNAGPGQGGQGGNPWHHGSW